MKIFCAYDKLLPVNDLKPNPRNPNIHSKEQIDTLCKVIKYNGWRSPITVSNRSGFVVRGHGRLTAALVLKEKKVPVDFQDYEDSDTEMADLLADNKLSELSKNNFKELAEILKDMPEADRQFAGLPDYEIDPLLAADWSEKEKSAASDGSPTFVASEEQAETITRAIEAVREATAKKMSHPDALTLICSVYLNEKEKG